ncbi:hypothetical protein CEXT_160051 [Caerostris extrusa]|uniref:Uncharacterized protein n=1 Tax=Caerostris extrusa TaxID=172846 RepID=A0AAV4NEN0_CAEEX|nr:hypothetical protein CEXT_160051 [Caerostris extrusa]
MKKMQRRKKKEVDAHSACNMPSKLLLEEGGGGGDGVNGGWVESAKVFSGPSVCIGYEGQSLKYMPVSQDTALFFPMFIPEFLTLSRRAGMPCIYLCVWQIVMRNARCRKGGRKTRMHKE